jgi:hypothetical protein
MEIEFVLNSAILVCLQMSWPEHVLKNVILHKDIMDNFLRHWEDVF